jgi:hypothetical protein
MNADSFENDTASARSDREPTVTNGTQAPKLQVSLLLTLIGVHRRPSAVPEELGDVFLHCSPHGTFSQRIRGSPCHLPAVSSKAALHAIGQARKKGGHVFVLPGRKKT